jgi:hypothetical protein
MCDKDVTTCLCTTERGESSVGLHLTDGYQHGFSELFYPTVKCLANTRMFHVVTHYLLIRLAYS